MEYELLPQGTLAEAIRAGGAGIGGFYIPTSAGTIIAKDRETKMLDGVEQVFIKGIKANVAFIRAWRADTAGNLTYRSGHVDVAVMGGLQVDEKANLANWAVPGKPLLGVSGAMDLAARAKKLIIIMTHTNTDGSSKIVPECSLPLTAYNVVDLIITELAVFNYNKGKLTLIELIPGVTLEEVRSKTNAEFEVKLKT